MEDEEIEAALRASAQEATPTPANSGAVGAQPIGRPDGPTPNGALGSSQGAAAAPAASLSSSARSSRDDTAAVGRSQSSSALATDEGFSKHAPPFGVVAGVGESLATNCALCTIDFDEANEEDRPHRFPCCGKSVCTSCLYELQSTIGPSASLCPFGCSMQEVPKGSKKGEESPASDADEDWLGSRKRSAVAAAEVDEDGDAEDDDEEEDDGTAAEEAAAEERRKRLKEIEKSDAALAAALAREEEQSAAFPLGGAPEANKKKKKKKAVSTGAEQAAHPLPSLFAPKPQAQAQPQAQAMAAAAAGSGASVSAAAGPAIVAGTGTGGRALIKVFWDIENAHLHDYQHHNSHYGSTGAGVGGGSGGVLVSSQSGRVLFVCFLLGACFSFPLFYFSSLLSSPLLCSALLFICRTPRASPSSPCCSC